MLSYNNYKLDWTLSFGFLITGLLPLQSLTLRNTLFLPDLWLRSRITPNILCLCIKKDKNILTVLNPHFITGFSNIPYFFLAVQSNCWCEVSMCCIWRKSNVRSLAVTHRSSSWHRAFIEKTCSPFIERVSISRQSQDGSWAESIFNSGKRRKHNSGKSILHSRLIIHHLLLNHRLPLSLFVSLTKGCPSLTMNYEQTYNSSTSLCCFWTKNYL